MVVAQEGLDLTKALLTVERQSVVLVVVREPKVPQNWMGRHKEGVETTAGDASLPAEPDIDDSIVEKDGRLVTPASNLTITDERVRQLRGASSQSYIEHLFGREHCHQREQSTSQDEQWIQ